MLAEAWFNDEGDFNVEMENGQNRLRICIDRLGRTHYTSVHDGRGSHGRGLWDRVYDSVRRLFEQVEQK